MTNPDDWVNGLTTTSWTEEKMEEEKNPLCDSCDRLGDSQPAISWCPECCDQLCENCVKYHHGNRLTMQHKVCNIADKNHIYSKKVDYFCKNHRYNRLEVYCLVHEEPCCLLCATVSHSTCKQVSSLDDCGKQFASDIPNILSQMEELQKTCETQITRMTLDMENLKKESKYFGQMTETMTEEIITALRDKQRTFLNYLERTENEQSVFVQKTQDEFLEVLNNVKLDIQILKNSEKLHRSGLFLELKRIGKAVSECRVRMNNLKKNYQTPILDVQIDEAIQTIHSSFNAFGEIKVKKLYQLKLRLPVLERSLDVERSLCLTDVEVIDDRYMVTICQHNKMVYMLDENGTQLSSLALPGSPWAIASIQNKTLCVTLRNPGRICFLKVDENLSMKIWKELKMPQNGWGICAVEDRIVVSVDSPNNCLIFRFYDQEDNYFERQIMHKVSRCGAMYAISSESFLFTNNEENSLFKVDTNNFKPAVQIYNGNDMKFPQGVTCDPEGNIYVAGFVSNNVLQFDKNGNILREIIHNDPAVQNPYGIRVKKLGDDIKLILTTKGKLLVYHFMQ